VDVISKHRSHISGIKRNLKSKLIQNLIEKRARLEMLRLKKNGKRVFKNKKGGD